MARDPSRVPGVGEGVGDKLGVEVVAADYADAESLAVVLRGVRAAFLVTNRVGGADDESFVRAARDAGTRHVVKLSAAAVEDPGAEDLITEWQRSSEQLVRDSGMQWTFLRPRAFMSNALGWAPSVRAEGVVRALYGFSGNAIVDPRDVAMVAVRALVDGGHEGRAYTLTGPVAVTAKQQAEELEARIGRPVRFEELTFDQARKQLRAKYPVEVADALLRSAERQRAGYKVRTTGDVEKVLGRPARSFGEWVGDHVAAFTAEVGSQAAKPSAVAEGGRSAE